MYLVQYYGAHPVYLVLDVCIYTWCSITVVHPEYIVIEVYIHLVQHYNCKLCV